MSSDECVTHPLVCPTTINSSHDKLESVNNKMGADNTIDEDFGYLSQADRRCQPRPDNLQIIGGVAVGAGLSIGSVVSVHHVVDLPTYFRGKASVHKYLHVVVSLVREHVELCLSV